MAKFIEVRTEDRTEYVNADQVERVLSDYPADGKSTLVMANGRTVAIDLPAADFVGRAME
jgi:hypothetical protein